MSDSEPPEPSSGLNFTQLWAAITALLFAVLLVITFRLPVLVAPSEAEITLQFQVYRTEDGKIIPVVPDAEVPRGAAVTFRLRNPDPGWVLLVGRNSRGQASHPDGFAAMELDRGWQQLDEVLTLDRPGPWMLTAILCPSRFTYTPDRPSVPFSCQTRAIPVKVVE